MFQGSFIRIKYIEYCMMNNSVPNWRFMNVPLLRVVYEKVEWASGYGGVVIVEHNLGQAVLMGIYGHARLKDIKVKPGDKITSGTLIGYLGNGYTNETDGERKHLHFGLYKGSVTDIRGYVVSQKELDAWLDPTRFMRGVSAKEVYPVRNSSF